MALITCPECGNQVSDKAEICPHCGIKIAGNIPLSQNKQNPHQPFVNDTRQNNNFTGQNKQNNKKSLKVILVSFTIALIVCGVAYYFYYNMQVQKEQEDYLFAMQSSDPMVLQMYLSKHNDAPYQHRDSVNARLTLLSNEDKDWKNTVINGTKSALVEYIKTHPTSQHLGEAADKIDSIDYAIAKRENTSTAYTKYLQRHPDGKYTIQAHEYLDEKKNTEVQPEEIVLAKTVCKHFFQAINAHNERKLLETVTDYLSNFLNKQGATAEDVIVFMNKLYKEDVQNLNWHIIDNFKIEKTKADDESHNIKVEFPAELIFERTDQTKEKQAKYIINADITPEGKITRLNMRKMNIQQ